MGIVALIAGGTAVAIKLYTWLKAQGAHGDAISTSIQRQAAVLGTFANFVFALLEALTTLKVAGRSVISTVVPTSGIGRPAGYIPTGLATQG